MSHWADDIRPVRPESGPLHYVNFASADCRVDPPRDCPDGQCVIAAIESASARLRQRGAPDASRIEALKQLVHFVGDVHQPLHAGFGDSRGGNRIQIRWRGRGSNLHRLWDTQLLDAATTGGDPLPARLAALAGRLDAGSPKPLDWAVESCRITGQDGFVPAAARFDEAAYVARWQGTLDTRLVQAGLRLAASLNAALDR